MSIGQDIFLRDQIEPAETSRKLDLTEDVYSLTFLKMVNLNDPLLHRDLMMKSVFTFAIQITLLYLIFNDPGLNKLVIESHAYLDTAKVICSILLHFVMAEEIRVSIGMIRYSITHCDKFVNCDDNFTYPFLIAIMKLSAAIITQLVQIYKMVYTSDTESVAKDFVAFVIISHIDDIVGKSLK